MTASAEPPLPPTNSLKPAQPEPTATLGSRWSRFGTGAAMPRIPQPGLPGWSLTNRELQVLAYQATGLSRTGISRELGISPRMLQRHISALTRKLPAGHRRGAAHHTGDARPDDSGWPFS